MSTVKLEWRPVVGFEGVYKVSNRGQIKRVLMTSGVRNMGKHLKHTLINSGYMAVHLSFGNNRRQELVHALVAAAFVGPRPEGHFVNHIDGDKMNNTAWNLEYLTPKESTAHALRIGAMPAGERHANAKLTDCQVAVIRATEGRVSASRIARRYGVSDGTVVKIRQGKSWRYAGSVGEPSSLIHSEPSSSSR